MNGAFLLTVRCKPQYRRDCAFGKYRNTARSMRLPMDWFRPTPPDRNASAQHPL
jgi:hypothetical protein